MSPHAGNPTRGGKMNKGEAPRLYATCRWNQGGRHPPQELAQNEVLLDCGFLSSMEPSGGVIPPRGIYAVDVYVSSNVSTSPKEPQHCIMYSSGQQQGRAGGPVKAPGPPTAAPKVSAPLDGACLRAKYCSE